MSDARNTGGGIFMAALLLLAVVVVNGNDREIPSQAKCGACGTPCRIVSGYHTKQQFEFGYNDLFEIPAGACSVNITQLRYTPNFLALRLLNGTYILNGDWAIKWSGSYHGAGVTFQYYRAHRKTHQGERIEAIGPLKKAVQVVLLFRHRSHGIQYSYAMPSPMEHINGVLNREHEIPFEQPYDIQYLRGSSVGGRSSLVQAQRGRPIETHYPAVPRLHSTTQTPQTPAAPPVPYQKPRSFFLDYTWRDLGFSECSKSCAGGRRVRDVVCVDKETQAIVTDDNCNPAHKPQVNIEPCNTVACPAEWIVDSEWSTCSTTCGPGQRTRTVYCAQRISESENVKVSAERCAAADKPPSLISCAGVPGHADTCGTWKMSAWTPCEDHCSMTWRTRRVKCVDNGHGHEIDSKLCAQPKPLERERCPNVATGCWFASRWTGAGCDAYCQGNYTRQLLCVDNTGKVNSDACREANRPGETRACHEVDDSKATSSSEQYRTCGGNWFVGAWSQCTADCKGVQKRTVLCMKKYGQFWHVIKPHNCEAAIQPESQRSCNVEACHSQWYTTTWSQCSRTCGRGTQRRRVLCLDSDQNVSNKCKLSDQPIEAKDCNEGECPANSEPIFLNQVQDCQDTMDRCHLVLKAGLCQFPYYKRRCCRTCPDY